LITRARLVPAVVVVWPVVVAAVDVVVLDTGVVVIVAIVVAGEVVVVAAVEVGVELVVCAWGCTGTESVRRPPVTVERFVVELPA
jgi:hypothetical protein